MNSMADINLDGAKVALLATQGVEQIELTGPRRALDDAGATTHLVSPASGPVRAWDEDDWGASFEPDATLDDADPADYDALVLPGGVMNPDLLRADEKAVAFVRHFVEADKPVAAICHGPWTLVEAGAVGGKRMTSWPSLQTDLRNAGATWVDEEVVRDGRLVTSRKPDDLPAFNRAVVELIGEAVAA